jgi:hypothetical protein
MSVYVGIDVHRKRSQVAVVTGDGTVELNKNVVNGPLRPGPATASGRYMGVRRAPLRGVDPRDRDLGTDRPCQFHTQWRRRVPAGSRTDRWLCCGEIPPRQIARWPTGTDQEDCDRR